MTWAVMGVIASYVAGCLADIGFEIYRYLVLSDARMQSTDVLRQRFDDLEPITRVLTVIGAVLFVAYAIAYFTWRNLTRRAIIAARADPGVLLGHWALRLWRIALVAGALLQFALVTRQTDVVDASAAGTTVVFVALAIVRTGIAGFLIAAIWMIRSVIRALPPSAPRPPKWKPSMAKVNDLRTEPRVEAGR